jgi:hypothetical protein
MAIVKQAGFDFQYGGPPDIRMQVSSINDRDNIPVLIRWRGMRVFIADEDREFILAGPVGDNSSWKEIAIGSSGRIQIATVGDSDPDNGDGLEGDIYYQNIDEGTRIWQKSSGGVWQTKGDLSGGGGVPLKMRVVISGVGSLTMNWSTPDSNVPLGSGIAPVDRFGSHGVFEIYQYGERQYPAIARTLDGSDVESYTFPLDNIETEIYIS